ncbi:MAG: hypothetical protein COV78_00145 [Candidatus Pacebacteria bacterium CG11_big_fil_rev_8_21_14_0_20_34_55]|nr:MAG: hypothetical protein COV78_00145 [Candidatus Pacebacteria bacterium CG11_big_fil_rev_8_21_14_0_20_34_55]
MTITKKRIRKIKTNFPHIEDNQEIYFGISVNSVNTKKIKDIGFEIPIQVGDAVLPKAMGPTSSFNSIGKELVRKDLPKEERVVQTREWTWKDWGGHQHSRWVDITKNCYQRDIIEAPSVELQIFNSDSASNLVLTPMFTMGKSSEDEMLHAVNLLLELFGECTVYNKELEGILPTPTRKLNWKILPQGTLPWHKIEPHLRPIINKSSQGNRAFIEKRLHLLAGEKPSFCAVGTAGFSGYVIFGFKNKSIYILESIYYGNATYVLGDDWKKLSRLTKAQIINRELAEERIIHSTHWWNNMKKVFKK